MFRASGMLGARSRVVTSRDSRSWLGTQLCVYFVHLKSLDWVDLSQEKAVLGRLHLAQGRGTICFLPGPRLWTGVICWVLLSG